MIFPYSYSNYTDEFRGTHNIFKIGILNSSKMVGKPLLDSDRQPQKGIRHGQNLSDEVDQLRRKILDSIIEEAGTLIDLQSSTNRSFIARTCPCAALSLEEALLHLLTRK